MRKYDEVQELLMVLRSGNLDGSKSYAEVMNEAADMIERMRKALIPFANEASHWVNYQDDERLVESFPGYEGDITVGNLRDAYDAMVNK